MRDFWLLGVCALIPLGCAPVCGKGDLEEGAIQAQIDGEDWQGAGTSWMWSGDGLHVNSTRTNGWMFTVRLMSSIQGHTIREAVDSGALPLEVRLDTDGLEGWMAAYPEEGGSYISKNDVRGSVTISQLDDTQLVACFDFTAEAGDGTTMDVAAGSMLAVAMP